MEENNFISITSLLCEPSRAKILWNLLDGRAYTAGELALASDLSATSVSNHLTKLLKGKILKVSVQGRHRYYSFANSDVAYAVESLANLANEHPLSTQPKISGIKYCRTCYDHLAGYVGVTLTEALENQGYLKKSGIVYDVTVKGWEWFSNLNISEKDFFKSRRSLTRQCLDWSERRSHLAGHLGAVFLQTMLQNGWFKKVEFSRELIITSKGRHSLYTLLGINFQ
ncbi:ArsR/SmtB family transcription factor [Abyssalbus ytuae]|uniref:ArsR family transcriptional regulator n=1 Tax=Abyssalbus ytuae TaxID=2926907 RepID=A0A9E7CSY0_9FLAO|nr:helix-turn-helix transcriptional regulator [Abyssalbus ytuae]UOB17051.1 ArsR family transcriptional regulator [Abyssalbus ytuae]